MTKPNKAPIAPRQRVGRPRRGTQEAREDALLDAATHAFLRDGYGSTSIEKVAREAGVSTRTIYQRFGNKADLLGAVVTRLVDQDVTLLSAAELNQLPLRDALLQIGRTVTVRMASPTVAPIIRIFATEAVRFPKLAAQIRAKSADRIDKAVEEYFRGQVLRRTLAVSDAHRAAALFTQMVAGELREFLLFGFADVGDATQIAAHVAFAVDVFLVGTLPRAARTARRAKT